MKMLPQQLIPLAAVVAIAAGGYFAFSRPGGIFAQLRALLEQALNEAA